MNGDDLLNALMLLDASDIKLVVQLVGLIGLLAGLLAMARLSRESGLLDLWIKDEAARVPKASFRKWVSEWVSAHQKASSSHLIKRLNCLLAALGNKGGNRTLPSLRDLHDLTMQEEMSRVAPLILRIVVSSLLIIGIIGTLVGVHNSIGLVTTKLDALQPALEPSMWAVGGTVLLLFIRGSYVGRMDKFLARLDTLTLNKLYVELQPASDLKGSISTLSAKIDNFTESSKVLGEAAGNIDLASHELKKAVDSLGNCGEHLGSLMDDTESMLKVLKDLNAQQQQICTQAESLFNATSDQQAWFAARKSKVDEALTSWGKMTQKISKTVEAFESIGKMSEYLPLALEHMKYQENILTTLTSYGANAKEEFEKLETLRQEMSQSASEAEAQVVSSRSLYADVAANIRQIVADKKSVREQLSALGSQISNDAEKVRSLTNRVVTSMERLRSSVDSAKVKIRI